MPSEEACDYCSEPLDHKIKQNSGHPDDWAKDNDGAYHWRCVPGGPMKGRVGGIAFYRPRYGSKDSTKLG
jgi:hypothetical protein